MPYKSKAQEAYFNANRKNLEAQGVNVDEWNSSSKGTKLPEKARGKTKATHKKPLKPTHKRPNSK